MTVIDLIVEHPLWLYGWGAWITFEYLVEVGVPWPVIAIVVVAWPIAVPILWLIGAVGKVWIALTQ